MYNSTIQLGDTNNPPIMAERGVSDGILTKDDNPVFNDGAHVLRACGEVLWLPAAHDGTLNLGDIKLEDLAALKP